MKMTRIEALRVPEAGRGYNSSATPCPCCGATSYCGHGENCPAFYATDRGTVGVQGSAVTDPEALAGLNLPAHEGIVEVRCHFSWPRLPASREQRSQGDT